MKLSALSLSCLVLAVSAASAQQLVHRSSLPGVPLMETDAETFLTPLPDPTANGFTFPAPFLPATAFPLGDLTMNNLTGVLYSTNGMLIAQHNDGRYGPLAPAAPPAPGPAIGPLTGIGFDSVAGLLHCTSGALLTTTGAMPPYVAGPVFAFAFPVLAPPMTGLDWSPLTASLWGCDAVGNVYNFTAAGLPIGPQPVFVPTLTTAGPATDLVLNRHGANVPGLYVQFLGGVVMNYMTGAIQPTAFLGLPPGTGAGIAMHNHPATLPGACPCIGPVFGPVAVGVTGPASIGNGGFGFTLSGALPGLPLIFGFDAGVAPIALAGGCTFWLPFPPLILVALVADPFGGAVFPAALPPIPALIGMTGYAQWAASCPTGPLGVVVSDAQQLIISAP